MDTHTERGDLFVISAPSGAGKSTLCHRLIEETPGVSFSVSHTTRSPRKGEVNGVDYHFVSEEEFMTIVKSNGFLEWAKVHGNCYGTSRDAVIEMLGNGRDVLLDIDVQGAMQVRRLIPEAVLVFILPPSPEELEKRLRNRGTDSEETIRLRLENAQKEVKAAKSYDFIVINDDLIRAAGDLQSIVLARRCSASRVLARSSTASLFTTSVCT